MTVKDAIKRAQNDARISSAEVTEQRGQCEFAQTLPSRDGTRCNQREHARPTVKDVFDLRKQGRIEEAYEAIKPMYAVHKGKYTTLCMFWTAADVFKLRLEQGRHEEASKIYEALKRMLPRIEEITKELDKQRDQKGTASSTAETKNVVARTAVENLPWENKNPQHSAHSAASFLQHAAHRLAAAAPAGSPSSSSSLHFSGESAPAGSPSSPAGSPSSSSSLHFSGESAPAGSPSSPAGSPAVPPVATVPAASPAVHSAVFPAPTVPTGSAGDPHSPHSPHSPHHGSDVPPLPWGQKKVFDCIKTYPGLSVPRISASTGIPQKSIERHIAALIDKKLIEHRGSKKTGGYYVL